MIFNRMKYCEDCNEYKKCKKVYIYGETCPVVVGWKWVCERCRKAEIIIERDFRKRCSSPPERNEKWIKEREMILKKELEKEVNNK